MFQEWIKNNYFEYKLAFTLNYLIIISWHYNIGKMQVYIGVNRGERVNLYFTHKEG